MQPIRWTLFSHLWHSKQPQHSYMNRANKSNFRKKRFVAFFTSHGTDHWGGTETDCRVIHYACHAKTYVCWPSSIMCQYSVMYCPSSQCHHANTGGSWALKSQPHATCRQAGGQGKKGDKIGWWSQTETVRESEGHLPHPSGCCVHSLCEGYWLQSGYLKRWGFEEHKNLKKRKHN